MLLHYCITGVKSSTSFSKYHFAVSTPAIGDKPTLPLHRCKGIGVSNKAVFFIVIMIACVSCMLQFEHITRKLVTTLNFVPAACS